MEKIIYKDESYITIGLCFEVHKNLGAGFLEIVYKDALEFECRSNGIPFEREKRYAVNYKGELLPHQFVADFVFFEKIIVEIKAVSQIQDYHIAQAINYLRISNNKLCLLVNFGELSLSHKRIVL